MQIFCAGETRFLERKLCKELYTAAAGLFGLYDIEGDFGKFRGVRLKSVRPVDISLVLISMKISTGKSGSAKTLTSLAGFRLHDIVRHF